MKKIMRCSMLLLTNQTVRYVKKMVIIMLVQCVSCVQWSLVVFPPSPLSCVRGLCVNCLKEKWQEFLLGSAKTFRDNAIYGTSWTRANCNYKWRNVIEMHSCAGNHIAMEWVILRWVNRYAASLLNSISRVTSLLWGNRFVLPRCVHLQRN